MAMLNIAFALLIPAVPNVQMNPLENACGRQNTEIIAELKKLAEQKIPTFGICLGHQLLALSQVAKTIKLKYPCIIYSLSDIYTRNADDRHYSMQKVYTVSVISRDPDNTIAESILEMPKTRFDRRYIVDNLYHDILTLYYKV